MLMKSIITLASAAAVMMAGGAAAYPHEKRSLNAPYMVGDKIRGVNLGGWFVLEPWITPTLFDAAPGTVDERTLCAALGKDGCLARLRTHWTSFYTPSDFSAIAAAGLNHVRIPVGYWAFNLLPGDPYVQGQVEFLDQAIGWAAGAGLKVWIDLHGAPGGQNGFDNSGWRDHLEWQVGDNVQRTVEAIGKIAERYGNNPNVAAIQLLNEPLGPNLNMDRVRQYWLDATAAVRSTSAIPIVIHDAFQPINSWNGFMTTTPSTILDTHQYQVFSPGELSRTLEQHIGKACDIGGQVSVSDKPTVVGEWSGALTDCTKHLNGVGRGARWDGGFPGSWWQGSCDGRVTGSVEGLGQEEKERTRRYVEAQLDAYERSAGWFFWTWKTELGSPQWDMRDLVGTGVFPQPITERRYGNQCGF